MNALDFHQPPPQACILEQAQRLIDQLWMRENFQAQRPIWQSAPQLSTQARIAVVGAGPSLNRDG